ncbi:MAG: DNA mismatch repair protein MutS, partial [Chloroflexi bacterium RBG_16_57_8]
MKDEITPIRRQYLRIKQKYPQAIVLFRLGDFYETFDEDAKTVARELEIVLTSREMGKGSRVPMAGIPYHALDNYLARLVNHGHKVAICEQMTKPGATRGIVEREVTRVVTPGTVVEPALLDSRRNNYLASLVLNDTEAGIAYVDITTSEFATTQMPIKKALPEIERLRPSEIIAANSADFVGWALPGEVGVTRLDDFSFELETAERTLLEHFKAASLDGYGCARLPLAVRAAGAIVQYIQQTQKGALDQLSRLSTYSTDSFMVLDEDTLSNLEVLRNSRTGLTEGSLLGVVDLTRTPMGSRLLRRWLSQPLLDLAELVERQEAVAWCHDRTLVRSQVISMLGKIVDLERVINRIGSGIALPREVVALRRSLEVVPALTEALQDGSTPAWLTDGLKPCPEVVDLITRSIADEPSSSLGEGNVVRKGFSEELDGLRTASQDARQYLANMERKEQERTAIKSLKVSYNRVFGYYIEVSNSNLPQVPADYIRKQTLVGGERFITPELKEYESLILNAKERIEELETNLFRQVCRQIAGEGERILALAGTLSRLDVITSLTEVAVGHDYVCPRLSEGNEITVKDGRHPVVERSLAGSAFVPNDVRLDNDDAQIIILTGPNMAGKSTYLKQVAL